MTRAIVFGNNRPAVEAAKHCIERPDIELVAVIPEGRNLLQLDDPYYGTVDASFTASQIWGVSVLAGNVNDHAAAIRDLAPDIMFGCRSFARVSPEVLAIPPLGVTNIHYGMLPRYGGCATLQHAILRGEDHVGVTFHFMSEEYDTGPIIAQDIIRMRGEPRHISMRGDGFHREYFTDGKTAHDLYMEASALGLQLFKDNLDAAIAGESRPQEGARLYFKAGAIDFERDRHMDIAGRTRTEVERHYRAFYFPAKQVPEYTAGGGPLTVEIVPYAGTGMRDTRHNAWRAAL